MENITERLLELLLKSLSCSELSVCQESKSVGNQFNKFRPFFFSSFSELRVSSKVHYMGQVP